LHTSQQQENSYPEINDLVADLQNIAVRFRPIIQKNVEQVSDYGKWVSELGQDGPER
jgi:hypothetical protein